MGYWLSREAYDDDPPDREDFYPNAWGLISCGTLTLFVIVFALLWVLT